MRMELVGGLVPLFRFRREHLVMETLTEVSVTWFRRRVTISHVKPR